MGFKHHKDYVGYVWAKQEEADFNRQEQQVIYTPPELCWAIIFPRISQMSDSCVSQVTFPEEELPKGSGDFILGYYSNNMSTLVGVTEPFQVLLT